MTALTVAPAHFHSHNAAMMIHRDQHQIRAQFLHSLGIVKPTPAATEEPSTQQEDLKYDNTATNDNPNQKISFAAHVTVKEIPSHREYSEEERLDLWNGAQAVAESVQRNTVEFRAEGWDWETVLEEESFVRLSSGELIHPATHQRQQEERRLKEQARKRRKNQRQYKYKSITACLQIVPKTNPKAPPRRRRRSTTTTRLAAQ